MMAWGEDQESTRIDLERGSVMFCQDFSGTPRFLKIEILSVQLHLLASTATIPRWSNGSIDPFGC
jgi:hypothetical protein